MNLFTPKECAANYAVAGAAKTRMPLVKMFLLAVLAGFFIAMGGAVTNTAAHSIGNVGVARTVCGLLFPFGLAMVVLTGAELFTWATPSGPCWWRRAAPLAASSTTPVGSWRCSA